MFGKLGFGLAVASCLALSAVAEPGITAPAGEAGLTAVSRFSTAMALAEFGRQRGDAIAILAAARIVMSDMRQSRLIDGPAETLGEGDGKLPGQAAMTEKPETEAHDLLAELFGRARAFALGDAALLAMIAETEQSASRASVTGAGSWNVRLSARTKRTIRESFYGGELAEVTVRGDGDTDVDLYIYDEAGREICRSAGLTDRESCRWTPARTAQFQIVVGNFGNVYNNVVVRTN